MFSQAVPAATESSAPLAIGGGVSSYTVDWGPGRKEDGATVWIDWEPNQLPSLLRGIGIEAEGRDISFDRNPNLPSNYRQAAVGAGPIYTFRHFRNVHPYIKYVVDIGDLDWNPSPDPQRTIVAVQAPGFGLELRVFRGVWVRGDYEYQFWKDVVPNKDRYLNPHGLTVGVMYDFRRRHNQ